jgi:hypothetical protein
MSFLNLTQEFLLLVAKPNLLARFALLFQRVVKGYEDAFGLSVLLGGFFF